MGVLARAELLMQAKNYGGSGDWLDEANSHDAQFGSLPGADTNDPLFLAHTGTQYAYFPGTTANYASAPDIAAYAYPNEMDVRVLVALDDWSDPGGQTLICQSKGGSDRSWRFDFSGTKKLQFILNHTDGNGGNSVASPGSTALSVANNGLIAVRAAVDFDNDAAGWDVTFYSKVTSDPADLADNTGWTTVSTHTIATARTLFENDSPIEIGDLFLGTAQPLTGKVYGAVLMTSINGTVVFDADFTDVNAVKEPFATFTEASSNAATVTINRNTSGRVSTIVDRPMFLLGTDDYFEIPDHANLDVGADDNFTLMIAGRTEDADGGGTVTLLAKKVGFGNEAGYVMYRSGTTSIRGKIGTGAASREDSTASGITSNIAFVTALRRDRPIDELEAFLDGTGSGSPIAALGGISLANAEALRIGRLSGAGASYFGGEIHGFALFREALTDADIVTAGDELLFGVPDEATRRIIRSPRYGVTRMATR